MSSFRLIAVIAVIGSSPIGAISVGADSLFSDTSWSNMTADRRASEVGDILTVIVAEATEARNSARNSSGRSHRFRADLSSRDVNEFGDLSFGSDFTGDGETRRSESLLTAISVSIDDVLSNGDYLISGEQRMFVSGEWTTIGVRGRIREADITAENEIPSNRIANAEINYNGEGFVSQGSRPGIIGRIFSWLGL